MNRVFLLDNPYIFRDDVVEGIFKPTWCGQTGDCALALATFDSKCCFLVLSLSFHPLTYHILERFNRAQQHNQNSRAY